MKDRVTHLAQLVYPRLFDRLDEAFPEFGWRRTAAGWVATNREFTKARLGARPDRVICNEPFGFLVHGGRAQTWLAYVNGGQRPTGREFIAAVRILEARAGVASSSGHEFRAGDKRAPSVRLTPECAEALVEATREDLAGPEGSVARDHLRSRGLGKATIGGFGLYTSWRAIGMRLAPRQRAELQAILTRAGRDRFWAGRVIIPWRDANGQIVSFVGYQIGPQSPRYLYAPGSRPPLFGVDRVAATGRPIENLILVEGIFDALRLHEEGIETCAAMGGTAVSPRLIAHIETLEALSVTLALDRDSPGLEATLVAVEAFRRSSSQVSVDVLPGELLGHCKDPDEFVQEYGPKAFLKALECRVAGSVVLATRMLARWDGEGGASARAVCLDELATLYATLPVTTRGRRERSELLDFIARRTGLESSMLRARFEGALRVERSRALATNLRSTLQCAASELRSTTDPLGVAVTLRTRLEALLGAHARQG